MVRAPCCEKMGLKRGPWTAEEDRILINHIQLYGHGNWRALPKQAGNLYTYVPWITFQQRLPCRSTHSLSYISL